MPKDGDEEDASHHGHEDKKVVEHSVYEEAVREKFEIHDRFRMTMFDEYENNKKENRCDVTRDAIERRTTPVESGVEHEDECRKGDTKGDGTPPVECMFCRFDDGFFYVIERHRESDETDREVDKEN